MARQSIMEGLQIVTTFYDPTAQSQRFAALDYTRPSINPPDAYPIQSTARTQVVVQAVQRLSADDAPPVEASWWLFVVMALVIAIDVLFH